MGNKKLTSQDDVGCETNKQDSIAWPKEWAAGVTSHSDGEKTLDAGLAWPGSPVLPGPRVQRAAKKQAGRDYEAGKEICAAAV